MREVLVDPTTLLAIDLAQSSKLIGSKDAAVEMLVLLKEKLPRDLGNITEAYETNNLGDLAHMAHRLVGGTAYCGVPAMRIAARALEYAAEDGSQGNIDACYIGLQQEVERFNVAVEAL